ncbi:hypothetical protein M409DRAFT_62382 [Zasmidium cellare ATCC 36951]|uniref:Uncharacterized protein n=1 Tax=Zasmidium cellare ATCC 36951 TaxID=1080233 RepID=A0A6A6D0A4_ZASCE|nr:uncharacterized protein M409DRAFT_62382 [Zasmidium cellare ATCC 36951]KAF2172615.1 hypothetical protein M409DRAFT_62382 [Zasmidium cellare ATCC 36951]
MSLVFFITGASSVFGTELALKAFDQGHKVIATVRNRQRAHGAVSKIEKQGGHVLELDVTNAPACFSVWKEAQAIHGHIDVLINNAGLAYLGANEDFADEEVHAQMDVNFYSPYRLIRAALPLFRQRKSGTIVNISSVAGIDEGMSEALARDVADHNIQVLIVEPGAFRTNFLGAYITNNLEHVDEYPVVKQVLERFKAVAGTQKGDPAKAAERIVEVVSGSGPAGGLKGKLLRLPLGRDCLGRFEAKIESLRRDVEAAREVAGSTDFEEV